MKPLTKSHATSFAAFTIIELLVVISIIATLAGLLLPAMAGARQRAKVRKATVEMNLLVTAIRQYQAEYTRMPASSSVEEAAKTKGSDYTFSNPIDANAEPNSTVLVILLDKDVAPNDGHKRNPRRIVGLNVKESFDTTSPGLGTDNVFRDPWGHPYVITLDMNFDQKCVDAFYGDTLVKGKEAVWSFGPDGKIESSYDPGNPQKGANKDNIRSWE